MDFIKEYALSIMVVSLLAILFDSILPTGSSRKYINMVIGLLVMLVILKPLTKLPHFSETFALPQMHIDDNALRSDSVRPYVAKQFEKKLSLAICEDVYSTFGETVSLRIYCAVNEAGQITDVQNVHLTPYTQEIAAYIAEKYGIRKDCIAP